MVSVLQVCLMVNIESGVINLAVVSITAQLLIARHSLNRNNFCS